VFDDGIFEAELVGSPLLQAHCLAAGAIVADLAGDRSEAARRGRRAHDLVRAQRAELVPTTALVASVQSLLEARAGNRDGAVSALAVARQHLSGYDPIAPWFNVMARLPLVKAAVLLGDRPLSRQLLREVDQHLRSQSPDNAARPHLEALRATVETAERLLPDGPWTLTAAEFRVLEHLPTSLSLADIAERLFVSRNTVKTHAAGIYRKLGARSRNEAVERARAAGVLEDRQPDP
jgi:LuxR family transcriptional regulator, maltose regulon positive regulatory protein